MITIPCIKNVVKPVVKSVFAGKDISPLDIPGVVLALDSQRLDGFSSQMPFALVRNSGDGLEYPIFGVRADGAWQSSPGGAWNSPATLYSVALANQAAVPIEFSTDDFVNRPGYGFEVLSYNSETETYSFQNSSGFGEMWKNAGAVNPGDMFLIDMEFDLSAGNYTNFAWNIHTSPSGYLSNSIYASSGDRRVYAPVVFEANSNGYPVFYTLLTGAIGTAEIYSIKKTTLNGSQPTAAYQPRYMVENGVWLLRFDGVDDYMTIAHNADIDFGEAESFTIFLRAKFTKNTAATLIADKYDNTSGQGYRLMQLSTGAFRFQIYSGGATKFIPSTNNYSGLWINIACVVDRDSSTITCYFGDEKKSINISGFGTIANSQDLVIGRSSQMAQNQKMDIQHGPYIWNRALTEAQIKELMRIE